MVVTTAHFSHRGPLGTLGGDRLRRDELGPFKRKEEGGKVLITFAPKSLPVTPVIVSLEEQDETAFAGFVHFEEEEARSKLCEKLVKANKNKSTIAKTIDA